MKIDLPAATTPDHPYRAETVTEAIRVYLAEQVKESLTTPESIVESSDTPTLLAASESE